MYSPKPHNRTFHASHERQLFGSQRLAPSRTAFLLLLAVGCSGTADDSARDTDGHQESGTDSAAPEVCEGTLGEAILELDCDNNGIEDAASIEAGHTKDTNFDGIPDICQAPDEAVYYGRENYVSYRPGHLPFVLLAPHGGSLVPDEIPARQGGTHVQDIYTYELTVAVSDALFSETGLRPHVVACHLDRSRLDCNRDLPEAAEDNPYAQQAWEEFHGFIDEAKANANAVFGQALVVDIHGMTRDRIEIGTLISGSQWLVGDSRLDHEAYAASSSLRHLSEQSERSFSSLNRGSLSLGAEFNARGHEAIPSPQSPDPGTDEDGNAMAFFDGGYNTSRHGSRHGGQSDAIQLEHPYSLRSSEQVRADYAADLSDSLIAFYEEMSGMTVAHPTGIRLEALDPILSESGNPGLLRAYRNGDISEELVVPLRITGQALLSTDLDISEELRFEENQGHVDLNLWAQDDALVEGPETFTIQIESQGDFQILGAPPEFWVADDESPHMWVASVAPEPDEGVSSTVILARDFCDTKEDFVVDLTGEITEEDFAEMPPEMISFEAGSGQVEWDISPHLDEQFEGAESLQINASKTTAELQSEATWSGWVRDSDLPAELIRWWDFSHLSSPHLDRASLSPLLLLPESAPPLPESNPNSSPAHWLAFDGVDDVALFENFPSESGSFWSIEFEFRARPEATNDYHYLWSHGSVGYRSSLNIYLTSNGTLRTGLRGEEDTWDYTLLDVGEALLDGEWHHYRLEIDWDSHTATVFLDGRLEKEESVGIGGYERRDHVFLGGRSDLRDSRHFWGDLADVKFAEF